ncbi:BTAD domain-containing putative transcriptional regulator [Nonomuraea sp. 3-1Str]|uniref:BTAD domain-containing putative transcriptional regulator n=1 Tax=Nonomuraea sp. 3-1Str TaxID=2929801 RepID=UPI00286FDAD4|nr:BTAD domain-containing putative transcriptional regulator [Nonomuraea sp. 3-1Str]
MLGPLAVWAPGGEPVQVPELKVRTLLADLLAHRGTPVSTDRLILDLWGDRPPAGAPAALRVKVSQLRRVLGDRDLIVHQGRGYVLRTGGALDVDADRFEALLDRARRGGGIPERRALLTEALALWRGPAYAGHGDEEFVRAEAARLEEQRLVALEELAETRLALGEHGPLAADLAGLVAEHPLRERLRAAQVRALYGAGRQGEALAGYADLRTRLADELGIDPGPELVTLHQAILERDPALEPPPRPSPPSSLAPSPAPFPAPANLPAALTPLVGRGGAVAEVRAVLDAHRLVTLTGPGGVGKTRLALEVAADPGRTFPGGVWLVELAASAPGGMAATGGMAVGSGGMEAATGGMAAGSSGVAEAVAATLGLRDDMPGSLADRLTDRLAAAPGTGETLLVLDNCEHVVEEVAELTGRLLGAAPGLRVLATSQESLRVSGEALWSVPPLSVEAAVELLTSRAGLPPAAEEPGRGALVEICERLDGIPLALELAAPRLRALTPRQLADRLDDRFRVLAPGLRGGPARQRTLRAMIDWSWELLGEQERVVLRRLAVHTGGCTLESAEAVCGEPGLDVLGPLARLVDRSLVVRSADGRYRLLESVAAYCLDRLGEAGELDAVRLRHARHYAELAERAEPYLRGHEQRRVLTLLDAESANVRAAIDHSVRLGAAGEAIRLVNAMAWYWVLRGRLGEGRRALETALSVPASASTPSGPAPSGPAPSAPGPSAPGPPDSGGARARLWLDGLEALAGRPRPVDAGLFEAVTDPAERAMARWFAGFALFGFDDLSVSMGLIESALAGFEALGDGWGTAAALSIRARWAGMRGDLATLRHDGERGLALFREAGDRWGEMRAAENLGTLAEITGDYEQAAGLRRDGLRMAEELGLWGAACDALSRLGRIAMLTGDHAQAEDLHGRARALAVAQSNRPAEEFAEVGLALGARRQGRLDEAERLLRKWIGWVREVSGAPGEALILSELGFVAELRGDAAAAQELHLGALAVARHVGDPRATALALEGLAGSRVLTGEHEEAARLLGKAAALRESAGAPLPPGERGDVDRITAAARAALGDDALAAALSRGTHAPLDALLPQPV